MVEMKVTKGSLWDGEFDDQVKVVPVNLGWKKNGENVMGRGVAKQAMKRYPSLPDWYGWRCEGMASRGIVEIHRYYDLLMFPVKPLFKTAPWLSWQRSADLDLVEESAKLLAFMCRGERIALPLVGCGNGGLDPAQVLPVLFKHLVGDRFTLVLTPVDYGRWKQIIEGLM